MQPLAPPEMLAEGSFTNVRKMTSRPSLGLRVAPTPRRFAPGFPHPRDQTQRLSDLRASPGLLFLSYTGLFLVQTKLILAPRHLFGLHCPFHIICAFHHLSFVQGSSPLSSQKRFSCPHYLMPPRNLYTRTASKALTHSFLFFKVCDDLRYASFWSIPLDYKGPGDRGGVCHSSLHSLFFFFFGRPHNVWSSHARSEL